MSRGKSRTALAEEVADLLILLLGTGLATEFDLNDAFWAKIEELMTREARLIGGRVCRFASFAA